MSKLKPLAIELQWPVEKDPKLNFLFRILNPPLGLFDRIEGRPDSECLKTASKFFQELQHPPKNICSNKFGEIVFTWLFEKRVVKIEPPPIPCKFIDDNRVSFTCPLQKRSLEIILNNQGDWKHLQKMESWDDFLKDGLLRLQKVSEKIEQESYLDNTGEAHRVVEEFLDNS